MAGVKKEYKELLHILDKILFYLVNKTDNYKADFYKMSGEEFQLSEKEVINRPSISYSFESIIEDIFSNFKEPTIKSNDLRLATIYLYNEGLITIDSKYTIEITFKGLLSYSEGIQNKWELEASVDHRLKTIQVDMLKQNEQIRFYTKWIMVGALVASVHYLLEILKVFCPFLCQ